MIQNGDVTEMDAWKENVQQDINTLKQGHDKLANDVNDLKLNDKLQDKEISTLHATLTSIQDDTKWIRRMFTRAFVTAFITAVVAGIVGVAIANIF